MGNERSQDQNEALECVLKRSVCRYQRTRRDCGLRIENLVLSKEIVWRLYQTPSSPEIRARLASLRKRQNGSAVPHSGDNSVVAPPVPIPNTEVKRCSPDGSTAIGRARVGRRQSKTPGGSSHRAFSALLRGSARASAGEGALAFTNFLCFISSTLNP
jgi:hypothetical protein